MADIPNRAPTAFHAGDTVKWLESARNFLPTDGWTLIADLTNGWNHYTITSTDNGDGQHLFLLTPADSDTYVVGEYRMGIAAINTAGDRYTIATLDIVVRPNLSGISDARSQVKKDLDALNAWITSGDVKVAEYTIAGRSMKYHDPITLEKLRAMRKREYRNEQNADLIASGHKPRRRLLTRMRG